MLAMARGCRLGWLILVLVGIFVEVSETAPLQCFSSTFTMTKQCNGSKIVSRGCYSSQADSDACSNFAGNFVDTALSEEVCQGALPQVCSQVGGTLKPGKSCGFACDALSSQPTSSCATNAECEKGSVKVCESQVQVSFSLSGLCCSYIYRIAQEYCDNVDCVKLEAFVESLRKKGMIAGGCADTGCKPGPNITSDTGLVGFQNVMTSINDKSSQCAPEAYGSQAVCADTNLAFAGVCKGVRVDSQSCASKGWDTGASCAQAVRDVDEFLTKERCRSVVAPMCEAVGAAIKCSTECGLLCGSLGSLTRNTCRNEVNCRDAPAAAAAPPRAWPTLCCSSVSRLITASCQGGTASTISAYVDGLRRKGGAQGGCDDTGCFSPPACEKVESMKFCQSINGFSVFNIQAVEKPLEWDAIVSNGWDMLPPEVFDKGEACKTAYKKWVCALNAQPCDPTTDTVTPLCASDCELYQACNMSLSQAKDRGDLTELEFKQRPGEICRGMGIRQTSDCFKGAAPPAALKTIGEGGGAGMGARPCLVWVVALAAAVFAIGNRVCGFR